MARPLSPEKREALLLSAMQAVAELGVMASTSSIARRAGVADGTLFTYFSSKEVLFQELYLHLKQSLVTAMMSDFPAQADYRQRMEYIFNRYVSWGLNNALERVVLARLSASGQVTADTRALGAQPFQAVSRTMEGGVEDGVLIDELHFFRDREYRHHHHRTHREVPGGGRQPPPAGLPYAVARHYGVKALPFN